MRRLHVTWMAALLAAACDGISDQALLPAPSSAALATGGSSGCLDLDFDTDGVLPGSQGMAYFSNPPGVPESASFSVTGGLLRMNTLYGGVETGYSLPHGFDPALDFTLEFRMRVLPGTDPFGVDFEVSDQATGKDFEFGFTPNGLRLPPPPPERAFLPFDASGAFHTYRVQAAGGSYGYQLWIDGAPAASGEVSGGDPGPGLFIFGDLTGGGNGAADIDFIRYCQVRGVTIDLKPGSLSNPVNPRASGMLPVAILSTAGFDARSVDPGTVRFGPAGTEAAPSRTAHEDADGDGATDVILHFRTAQTGITCATSSVTLTGRAFGVPVSGTDSLLPTGCG